MALDHAARHFLVTLVLAGILNGLALPAPATTRAADLAPSRLLFWNLPTDVYVGRPFDVVVAIVAFPDSLGVVVTQGTTATVSRLLPVARYSVR